MLSATPHQLSVAYGAELNTLDTEAEVLVQVVLLLARIRERDVVERDDGRRELADVLEVEAQRLRRLDLLDEACRLHLVDDLLLGLGLLDQVRVCTRRCDEPARRRVRTEEWGGRGGMYFLMCAISSCCLLYAFIWLTSFSAFVRTYVE